MIEEAITRRGFHHSRERRTRPLDEEGAVRIALRCEDWGRSVVAGMAGRLAWLLVQRSFRFDWDEGNQTKSAFTVRGAGKTSFDSNKIKAAYRKVKAAKKYPTSINLSAETVTELKRLAASRGVPYQTLMRMFVLEGLARLKKAA